MKFTEGDVVKFNWSVSLTNQNWKDIWRYDGHIYYSIPLIVKYYVKNTLMLFFGWFYSYDKQKGWELFIMDQQESNSLVIWSSIECELN
jgi:hypothetical protein